MCDRLEVDAGSLRQSESQLRKIRESVQPLKAKDLLTIQEVVDRGSPSVV